MKFTTILGLMFGALGALNLYQGNYQTIYFLFVGIGFTLLFGGLILSSTKNKISSSIAEKKEEKEFQKQLRRKAQEEEALGKARNKAQIELLGAQTKSLIEQMKAGEQVQGQLLAKYQELTAMGDSSYEYLKKEIRNMPAMKNTNFNL